MHVEPITCYRPRPDAAAAFSVPHRVSDDPAEARAWAEAREASFAAIACPGAAGPDGGDEGAALERAHDLLAERVADGTLLRDGTPCYYLYRLRRSGRELTGIVAACSVDDCNNGVVRRVEATSRDLEDAHVRHIAATGCQSAPVLLAYRDNPVLEALVEAAKTADPLYDFTDEEATRHSVWRVARPAAVESLRLMLEHVGRAYVVGAHHRAAAAARVCQAMRTEGGERSSGAEAYNYLLCALFPASQVRLLPRHVVVADTAGLDEGELVAALERAGLVVGPRREEPVAPAERGRIGMYAFGAWRELSRGGVGAGEETDASVALDRVVADVLGAREDGRARSASPLAGPAELERAAGEGGVALALFPPSTGEAMAVADAGRTLPAGSTWLEPAPRDGLFVRRVSHRASLIDGARPRRA